MEERTRKEEGTVEGRRARGGWQGLRQGEYSESATMPRRTGRNDGEPGGLGRRGAKEKDTKGRGGERSEPRIRVGREGDEEEYRNRRKRRVEDGVLMNMTDYNFTLWVV